MIIYRLLLLVPTICSLRIDSYCRLNPETFSRCSCVRVGPNEVNVECQRKQWFTVPALDKLFSADDQNSMLVNKLELKHGVLGSINQDAFKNQQIRVLDLGHNNIKSVNVNAFRGLETTLKSLDLQANMLDLIPIWSLTFLQNLQYLRLQDNQISSVDANTAVETKLNQLHYMHLDRNKIERLGPASLARFPLSVLTLAGNRIANLDKDSLPTSLNFLDLSNNQLEAIPYPTLFNLTQLSSLDLSGNRIANLKASQNVRFKADIKLNLAGNKIQRLEEDAFASFQRIFDLNLEMNQIEYLDEKVFSYVSKLERLSLRFNRLAQMHKKTFGHLGKNLKSLDLSFNEFQELPSALESLSSLEELNLQNNRLRLLDNNRVVNFKHILRRLNLQFNQLSQVQFDVFDGMQRLEELDLSNNQIDGLGKIAFGTVTGAASSLQMLNLAGNKIKEITDPSSFLYFTSLIVLNLSFNKLKNIAPEAFNRLSSLKSLNLEHNQLSSFPKSAFFNLKKLANLQFNQNQVKSLPVRVFELSPQLVEAHLMANKIRLINDQIFHVSSTQRLEWLNLAKNRIEEIGSSAFESLPRLVHLDLHGNRLVHINPQAFNSLPNLINLNLERNSIRILHDFSFNQLPILKHLNLAHNQLEEISESAFQNVTQLEHLSLSHNKFPQFNFSFLNNQVKNLMVLDLSYNKLTRINLENANHQLMHFSLRYNNLEFIDNLIFNSCHRLKHLDLSLNSILEIHVDAFQAAKKLVHLDISGNQLRTIWRETFSYQESIEFLDLSHNFLTNNLDAGVFGRDNVVKLVLSYNNLTTVPTKALGSIRKSLKELDLSFNQIRSLSAADFHNLVNIKKLILSNNIIDSIEANAFEEMPWIEFLDLSHNPISTWSPQSFQRISNVLQSINLASTGLFSLPKLNTKSLKFLNISNNKIYELHESDVESLRMLRVLDLSDNNIKELTPAALQALSRLKHLNLDGNRLQFLEVNHLSNLSELETLQISRQPDLFRIPSPESFARLIQLQNLHLYDLPQVSNYNISEILRWLPPLRTLHFQINSFIFDKQLSNVDLRLLNELTVSGKKLKMIDPSALDGIRRYKFRLVIRDTSVTDLPSSLFDNINSVRIFDLQLPDNKIESLKLFRHDNPPILNQHGTILEYLNLQGNPLICDCQLKWLNELINYYSEHATNWIQIRNSLALTRCSDRPGGVDNLLNLYDISGHEYAAFQRYNHERNERRVERLKFESLSGALDCRKKNSGGLVSFFSSSTASASKWQISLTGFLISILSACLL